MAAKKETAKEISGKGMLDCNIDRQFRLRGLNRTREEEEKLKALKAQKENSKIMSAQALDVVKKDVRTRVDWMYRMVADPNANMNSREMNRDAAFELLTIENGYAFIGLMKPPEALKTYKLLIANFKEFTKDQLTVLRSKHFPLRQEYLKAGGDPKAGEDVVGKDPPADGQGSTHGSAIQAAAKAATSGNNPNPNASANNANKRPAPAAAAEPEKKARGWVRKPVVYGTYGT